MLVYIYFVVFVFLLVPFEGKYQFLTGKAASIL